MLILNLNLNKVMELVLYLLLSVWFFLGIFLVRYANRKSRNTKLSKRDLQNIKVRFFIYLFSSLFVMTILIGILSWYASRR